MPSPSVRPDSTAPLTIVCGSGSFPIAVAKVASQTRPVFLIGLTGTTDPAIEAYPHGWVRIGQFGRMLALARQSGGTDILFVGGANRPSGWRDVRPDFRLLTLIPRFIKAFRGGDDHLLKQIAQAVTEAGFTLRGVQEIAPQLMLPEGPVGQIVPTAAALSDAELGFRLIDAMAPFDVGQGVVVAANRVVAVEAAEGTDAMLDRVASLRESGRLRLPPGQGVFVKSPKRGQDIRLDMPALGPATIEKVRKAGLAGIAVAAGQVMAVDAEQMIAAADEAGLFVTGVERGAP